MDAMNAEPEDDGDAAQAFEALREEVAALRRGVELVYRQSQQVPPAAPDYSPTLGTMAQALQAIAGRLEAVELAPALRLTPGQQAAELRQQLFQIGQDARGGLAHSQARLDATVEELRGIIGSARTGLDQKQRLLTVGAIGVMGGMLLWFMLTVMLPWGGGTWLAGLAFGGRWNAGEAIMHDANAVAWDRMVRLYNACPQDSLTELCEAAIAVRTIPPAREDGGRTAPAPLRPPSRGDHGGSQGQ